MGYYYNYYAQRKCTEGTIQELIFSWAAYNLHTYPELELLYHIPNGGKRDAKTATVLKRQGVKAGVPDLHLPVAKGIYHGLYIELKKDKSGTVSDYQKSWIARLNAQGYYATVCYGYDEAIETLRAYLELTPEELMSNEQKAAKKERQKQN